MKYRIKEYSFIIRGIVYMKFEIQSKRSIFTSWENRGTYDSLSDAEKQLPFFKKFDIDWNKLKFPIFHNY